MHLDIFWRFEDFIFHNHISVEKFFIDNPGLNEEEKKLSIYEYLNFELNRNILHLFLPILKSSRIDNTVELHDRFNKYTEYLVENSSHRTVYRIEILSVCNRFLSILFKRGVLDMDIYNNMYKDGNFVKCYSEIDVKAKPFSHYGFLTGSKLNIENPMKIKVELFKNLINSKMISSYTDRSDFITIFDYKLSGVQINWIKPKNQLAYFIHLLKELEYIDDNKFWEKSLSIFLVNNEPIKSASTLRNSWDEPSIKIKKQIDSFFVNDN